MSSRRIGILHVVHSLNVGGAEKLVFDLTRRTDPARFAVSVACLDEAGVSIASILKEREFALPIVEATTKQQRPLRVGDDVDVTLALEKLGTGSLIVLGTLKVGDVVVATTRTVHVAIDGQGRSRPLPEAFKAAVGARLPLVSPTT